MPVPQLIHEWSERTASQYGPSCQFRIVQTKYQYPIKFVLEISTEIDAMLKPIWRVLGNDELSDSDLKQILREFSRVKDKLIQELRHTVELEKHLERLEMSDVAEKTEAV